MKTIKFVREHVVPERIVFWTNTVLGLGEAVEAGHRHRPPALLHRRPPAPLCSSASPKRDPELCSGSSGS